MRSLIVGACLLLGCDGEVLELTDGPATPLVDWSMLPYGAAKQAATRPPPQGPPLSARHLEGVFPPKWHVGDQWIVERHEPKAAQMAAAPEIYILKTRYLFRVVEEPVEADGEYRMDIRRLIRPYDGDTGGPRIEAVDAAEGQISASFWARDHSLIVARDMTELDKPWGVEENGPHPFVGLRDPTRYDGHDVPLDAFPSVPPTLDNPFVWRMAGVARSRCWQVIRPTEEGLVFEIEVLTWRGDEPYGVEEARIEWRRGEPWWSLVTTVDRYAAPPAEKGAELVDGRMVHARLLRNPDTGEPL